MLADATCSDIGQRYKMQQVLGSGAQATVYQAVAKKSQRKTAVKVLDQNELKDDDLFGALRMEIMILKQLKHPCAGPEGEVRHPSLRLTHLFSAHPDTSST